MNTKKFTQITLALVLAITIVTGVRFVLASGGGIIGWIDPTGVPPTNNADAPINVGSLVTDSPQNKLNGLNVGGVTTQGGAISGYVNILNTSGLSTYALTAYKDAAFKQNVYITGNTGIGTAVPGADLEIKSTGTYASPLGGNYTGGQLVIGNLTNGDGQRLELGYNTTADNAFINAGNYFPAQGNGPRTLILQPDGGAVNVGGTLAITGNTTIGGTLKISGGTPGAGKVLTSDANGLASWTTPASGGGLSGSGTTSYLPKWTSGSALGDSLIYDNGAGIGIRTTTIPSSLTVVTTGKVGALAYCDQDGNNCTSPSQFAKIKGDMILVSFDLNVNQIATDSPWVLNNCRVLMTTKNNPNACPVSFGRMVRLGTGDYILDIHDTNNVTIIPLAVTLLNQNEGLNKINLGNSSPSGYGSYIEIRTSDDSTANDLSGSDVIKFIALAQS